MNDILINSVSRLAAAHTSNARWTVAKEIARDFGFNALNITSANSETGEFNWTLSAMHQGWLEDYLAQKMFEIDPLIAQLFTRERFIQIQGGTLFRADNVTELQIEYNQQLKEVGYPSLFSFSVAGHSKNESRIVVFSGDEPHTEYERAIGIQNLQFIATAIGSMMMPPESPWGDETYYIDKDPLSRRETEVLSLLALGHRNLEIAARLNVSEVTVRMHITSARQKLRAATREEALVKAAASGMLVM